MTNVKAVACLFYNMILKWFQNLQSGSSLRRDKTFNRRNIYNISRIERLVPTKRLDLRVVLKPLLTDLTQMIGQIIKADCEVHIFHQTVLRPSQLNGRKIENGLNPYIHKPIRHGLGV